jgi:hypothetical protein
LTPHGPAKLQGTSAPIRAGALNRRRTKGGDNGATVAGRHGVPHYQHSAFGDQWHEQVRQAKSWISTLDDLEIDGVHYIVNLVARKGTGVQGYRVTVDYIPHDGAGGGARELPQAASTADVHRISRDLAGDLRGLVELWRGTAA